MLVIFDIDGTLIGGETFDWASFDESFEASAGFALQPSFWDSLEEVTAASVVHSALAKHPQAERERLEELVRLGYLERLKHAHRTHPEAFRPTTGAPELLKSLRTSPGVSVAIATGDWHSSSSFKLAAAGFDLEGISVATCSDCHTRADIIFLAATRARRPVSDAIYVGDGRWDYRACRQLGIPFIGTGCRMDELRAAGAKHLLPNLLPGPFWEMLKTITRPAVNAASPASATAPRCEL